MVMESFRREQLIKPDKGVNKPPSFLEVTGTNEPIQGPTKQNVLNTLKLDKALRLVNQKIKEGCLEEAKLVCQDILVIL